MLCTMTPAPPMHPSIVEHQRCGRRIHKAFKAEPVMSIMIDQSVAQSGPFDGACLIAAKAILNLIGQGELVRITSNLNGGQTEHYGVQVAGGIFDADGDYGTPRKWIRRFAQLESVCDRELRLAFGFDPKGMAPDDPIAVKALSLELRRLICGA